MIDKTTEWNGSWSEGSGGSKDYMDLLIQSAKLDGKETSAIGGSCKVDAILNDKKCTFNEIKISKEDRKFDLILNGDEKDGNLIYEVITGNKFSKKKIKCNVIGLVDSKGDHKNKVILFNDDFIKKNDSELEFFCKSNVMQWQFPSKVEPKPYKITVNTCGKSITANINCYQDLEIYGGFFWNYSNVESSIKESFEAESRKYQTKDKNNKKVGKFEKGVAEKENHNITSEKKAFGVFGEIKYDGFTVKFETAFKDVIEKIEAISLGFKKIESTFSEIKKISDGLNSVVEKKEPNKLEIKLLNLKLGINGKWNEIEGSPLCDYSTTIMFESDPIWSITYDVEIIKYILNIAPAVGIFKQILDSVGIDALSIRIKFGFELKGNFNVDFYRNEKTKVSGEIKLAVPIEVYAILIKIEVDKEILGTAIKVVTELSAKAKSEIFGSINYETEENVLKCKYGHDDLKCYILAKASVDITYKKNVKKNVEGSTTNQKKMENKNEVENPPIYQLDKSDFDPIPIIDFN